LRLWAGFARCQRAAEAALAAEKFGRLDVAVNNAGTLGEAGPSTEVSEAGWNAAIAINLTGAFLGAKHQIAEMMNHGGGSVIFTSTFVGYSFAFPGVAAFCHWHRLIGRRRRLDHPDLSRLPLLAEPGSK
jgi:NAD(P)-dependent dehydrogenase (short-subunit alcohol dehydrogenase family)